MQRQVWVRAAGVVATLVAMVALVGCQVDTTVDLVVNPDGSGTVMVTVTADAAVVDQAPDLGESLALDDLVASGWTVVGPTPTDAGGLEVVLTRPFASVAEGNAVLAQLSGPNGPLIGPVVAAAGTAGDVQWSFDGVLDLTRALDAFADQDLVTAVGATPWLDALTAQGISPADAVGMTMRVSLPGTRVAEPGVTAPPGAAEWSVRAGDPAVTMESRTLAVSEEVLEARRVERRFLTALIGYGVLVAVLVGAWFYLRSRRRPAARRPAP